MSTKIALQTILNCSNLKHISESFAFAFKESIKTMYVCMCNPFTDKDLDKALQDENVRKKTSSVYQACTGGEKPCCGTCICEIRDRVNKHNAEALALAAE